MPDPVGIPPVSPLSWVAASAPIAVLLVLMLAARWGGQRAGPAALLVALGVALVAFGADARLLALSQGKAVLLSLWVLYIVWAALFLFYIVDEAGGIRTIGQALARITPDRTLQVLLLAWVFTSLLQGIAGYGVPVAVVAPLMVGLGFGAETAVVATSIGHSWSVTFGSLAASFFVLVGVSGVPGPELAAPAAALLWLSCILCGGGAVLAYGGAGALRRAAVPLVLVGSVMGGVQLALAVAGAYSLAAFAGAGAGLMALGLLARLPRYKQASPPARPTRGHSSPEPAAVEPQVGVGAFVRAFSAYLILIVVVLTVSFVPHIADALNVIRLELAFPATSTSFGWTNEATDSYRTIRPFGDAGAFLVYAALLGHLTYQHAGTSATATLGRALRRTVKSAVPSSLGIMSMVGMALAMTDSGMTYLLARGLVDLAGPAFPFISPFIGLLGAFMTGSNTNSNVLFGALQRDSAHLLGLSPAIMLASQTAGGALGSMMAPAKVILGCSAVGLGGQEASAIRRGIAYGIVITAIVGIVVLVWAGAA